MLEQLRVDPKKISQPSRDNISRELYFFKTDVINNFKAPWVTNALDGSENYLVWERTIALVGSHLKKFQDELKKKESPKSLKLKKNIMKISMMERDLKIKTLSQAKLLLLWRFIPPAATKAIPAPVMLADLCERFWLAQRCSISWSIWETVIGCWNYKKFPSTPD